ncbi:Transmembrane protein 19 [Trachymyrmex septentrionalis]|uniref:Transmembrane protein 19 n=1 Tax=Trachymyrmex septentrionalis TaxID=34720 RepID=A0A195F414_9HYME|nr:PREDICTED: transmembrane protein 19 [Trachymyrmex septentrionalis]KYN35320.1 Transmembrane protein 19 [Trachymyrmex septentrionalis]
MVSLGSHKESRHSHVLMPVLLSACAIPISMFFWIVNVVYSILWPDTVNLTEEHSVISPWRWLAAIVIPLIFLFWGVRKKSLDISGGILGFFMGFILTLSSFAHLMALVTFFVTASKVTKFRSEQKKKMEADFKEGGQRNWIQVLCNGGMATQLALLYLLDVGSGERPIDFDKEYRSSWLSIGIIGAFACCNGDTWASELGTVIGMGDPFLITTRKKVPRGTNGGVSWIGLICSVIGGLVVGLFYYIMVLNTVDTAVLQLAAPQWPIIIVAAFGGLFGSILDSILGATLQYSGVDEKGIIVERPGKGVKHICGKQILDNHSVNLLSTIGIALILPRIANIFWP